MGRKAIHCILKGEKLEQGEKIIKLHTKTTQATTKNERKNKKMEATL